MNKYAVQRNKHQSRPVSTYIRIWLGKDHFVSLSVDNQTGRVTDIVSDDEQPFQQINYL